MAEDKVARWPDYEMQGLEIYEELRFAVHDPWLGREVAVFSSREDAEEYARIMLKRWKKANK